MRSGEDFRPDYPRLMGGGTPVEIFIFYRRDNSAL
jgi:hypothetical protein